MFSLKYKKSQIIMIYVIQSGGRIGNMLFQVAAGFSISNNVTLCIVNNDEKEYIKKYKLKETIFRKIKVIDDYPSCSNIHNQNSFNYEKIPYIGNEDIAIAGSFQSEKYLDKNKVWDLFEIDTETKRTINQRFGKLINEEITSIHVRRGDFLKSPHRWTFCGKKYYRDAIKLIGKEKKYLVASDDIPWCKKVFKGNNFYFVENSTILIDLYIQSLCTNNIISNSTFSWWGAYLNKNPNKIVIAPKRWFGIDLKLDTQDLIPSSYIIIDNRNFITRYLYGNYMKYKEKSIKSLQKSALRPYLKILRNLMQN